MAARTKARKRAVDVLYEADLRSVDPLVVLRDRIADGTDYVFMDGDTYDQIYVPATTLGDGANYLLENTEVIVAVHDSTPLYVELPVTMELVVEHTDPGLQGDRSTGGTKPATLETGAQIQVPLFITTGEKLKVDTRDGRYLGRVN